MHVGFQAISFPVFHNFGCLPFLQSWATHCGTVFGTLHLCTSSRWYTHLRRLRPPTKRPHQSIDGFVNVINAPFQFPRPLTHPGFPANGLADLNVGSDGQILAPELKRNIKEIFRLPVARPCSVLASPRVLQKAIAATCTTGGRGSLSDCTTIVARTSLGYVRLLRKAAAFASRYLVGTAGFLRKANANTLSNVILTCHGLQLT